MVCVGVGLSDLAWLRGKGIGYAAVVAEEDWRADADVGLGG